MPHVGRAEYREREACADVLPIGAGAVPGPMGSGSYFVISIVPFMFGWSPQMYS